MTNEEAIAKLKNFADHCYPNEEFLMAIKALEQEPKTGHWIKDDITERSKSAYKHKCDRCGAYHRAMYDYCPSCGAKMFEPQESENP